MGEEEWKSAMIEAFVLVLINHLNCNANLGLAQVTIC